MAAPVLAKVIGVKVAAANVGEYVIVRNLTRGGQLTGKLGGSDRSVVLNPAPSLAWQEKDLIQGEIESSVSGFKQETISAGKADIKISAAADTSVPGVDL